MIWAIIMMAVGASGAALVFVFAAGPLAGGTFTSSGQRIYYTGASVTGPIPRTVAGGGMMGRGMMGGAGCVDCHGEDGRGGRASTMFGVVDIPDIRYSTLTTPRSEDGTSVAAWSDADIARAIRDGVEPNGQQLEGPMPRWDMTDAEMDDVIAFLKELKAK